MSCVHITGCQLAPSSYAFPLQTLQLNKASAITLPTFTLPYFRREVPRISLTAAFLTSGCQQLAPVCLFGGKGKSENGNEASPWKAIEKAMGSFQKSNSVEDLLKDQIQKEECYDYDDGGSGGKPPGGGGGGGDGFGEPEDEGLSGVWEEFSQVILATFGVIFLINALAKDFLKYLFTRKQSIRLRRLIEQSKKFVQSMRGEEYYDPNGEIISTPSMYDIPAKYEKIIKRFKTILNSVPEDDDYDDDD